VRGTFHVSGLEYTYKGKIPTCKEGTSHQGAYEGQMLVEAKAGESGSSVPLEIWPNG
jgi:hypothetical protein